MIKPYDFTLDIKGRSNIPRIECVQGDTNSYRLNINLIDKSLPVVLTNQTVKLVCRKPDNTTVFQDFTVTGALEGEISAILKSQAYTALGKCVCEIKIYGTNLALEPERLTSASFEYWVVESLLDETAAESTNEFSALTEALAAVEGAVDIIPTIEDINTTLQSSITSGNALIAEAEIKQADLATVIATADLTTYTSKAEFLLAKGGLITIAPYNSVQKASARIILDGEDDSYAINNAISMLSAGGRIILLDGTVMLAQPIRPKSKISIEGSGEATVLKATADINAIENTEYLEFFNLSNLSIDMDRDHNTFVSGGTALHLSMTHSSVKNVNAKNAKHNLKLNFDNFAGEQTGLLNKIEHCNFQDSTDIGVCWGWRTTDSWFCFNNVGSLGANMKIQGSVGRFIGNHFNGGSPEYNILMPDGARSLIFESNIFEQGLKGSIYVGAAVFDLVVASNLFSNAGYLAPGADVIRIEGLMDGVDKSKNIIISNNLFKKNTPDNTSVKYCVHIRQAEKISLMGNSFGDGYNTEQPIAFEVATVTDYEVLGNCGNNAVLLY